MAGVSALGCCWLIGGTGDSGAIARRLSELAVPYVVTVTTAAARALYPEGACVEVGKLSLQTAQAFVERCGVRCVADVSHPFAREVSEMAIAVARERRIPYLRYERPLVGGSPASFEAASPTQRLGQRALADTQADWQEGVVRAGSLDALVDDSRLRGQLEGQRVLFTIGYRHLGKFAGLRARSRLFARVLPSKEAIAGARGAGFEASELIALRPPISLALEMALWQQWDISCVVARASGKPSGWGGEQVKREAARALGVRLMLVDRPVLSYPHKTERLESVIGFCQKNLACFSRKGGNSL